MSEPIAPPAPTKSAYRQIKPKQRRFVDLVVAGKGYSEAALLAKYSAKAPDTAAWKLMQQPLVRAAIAEREEEAIQAAGVTAAQVLQRVSRIASLSVKDFVHPDGRPKKVHELDDDVAAAIQSIEVEHLLGEAKRTKFRVPSKNEANKLLGQYLKMWTERRELSGVNGQPLVPPTIGITFDDGGPGAAPPADDGVETST